MDEIDGDRNVSLFPYLMYRSSGHSAPASDACRTAGRIECNVIPNRDWPVCHPNRPAWLSAAVSEPAPGGVSEFHSGGSSSITTQPGWEHARRPLRRHEFAR